MFDRKEVLAASKKLKTLATTNNSGMTVQLTGKVAHLTKTSGSGPLSIPDVTLSIPVISDGVFFADTVEAVVNASQFVDLLTKLKDKSIGLSLSENNQLVVEYARGKFEFEEDRDLEVLDAQDQNCLFHFDFLPEYKTLASYCSKDDLRPAMCGVFIHAKENVLTAVATDAHVMRVSVIGSSPAFPGIIIPNSVTPLLFEGEFYSNGRVATIENEDGSTLSFRLTDARYPDYQSIIRDAGNTQIVVDKAEFVEAMDVVTLAAPNKKYAKVLLDTENFILSNYNSDRKSEANWQMQHAEKFFDGNFTIAFDPNKMAKVVKDQQKKHIAIDFSEDAPDRRAMVIRENSTTTVLMPVMKD